MYGIPFRWRSYLGTLLLFSLLGGCATSGDHDPFTDKAFKGPTLKAVRTDNDPNAFRNTRVRWGGSIAGVENRRDETWLEIVQQPLRNSGRPDAGGASEGRFIVRIGGFLDPAIYAEGRQITIMGRLTDRIQRNIGEYPYQFPVVTAEQYRLWKARQEPEIIYYRDPFWDPWYWPRRHYRHYRRY